MRGIGRTLIASAVVAALVAASLAIAAPNGNGGSDGSAAKGKGRPLSDLASKLGVSASDLRAAFKAAHRQVGKPSAEERAALEQRCTEVTNQIATKLGKSGDEVRAATKAAAKEGLADAVKSGKLDQARADAIAKRIGSKSCLPLGGPMMGGPKGGPPGGVHGDGPRGDVAEGPEGEDPRGGPGLRGGPGHGGPGRPGKLLGAVAEKLDVSQADLRKAVRESQVAAGEPSEQQREAMEKRCTALTDAVGKEIGKSGDEVRAATKAIAKEHIERAVKSGRLDQNQADELLERLDSRACGPVKLRMRMGGPGHGPAHGLGPG